MSSVRSLGASLTLLWLIVAAAPLMASPVIDDTRLAKQFVAGLGPLAESGDTLQAEVIRTALEASVGAAVASPEAATPCSITQDEALYDAVVPAIVAVGSVFKCEKCSDWHIGGLATGWLLSADGLVVTNHHVLQREKGHSFGVMTSDGAVYAIKEVVASDPAGDAAVVRIDTRGRQLPFLVLGEPPACGEPVTVISHPRGRFYCLTEGVVSRYHRQQAATWMSVTADYAIGSSGGPVFDPAGKVVGMVSRTFNASLPKSGDKSQPTAAPAVPEQMVFKDCVSVETLRKLLETH